MSHDVILIRELGAFGLQVPEELGGVGLTNTQVINQLILCLDNRGLVATMILYKL